MQNEIRGLMRDTNLVPSEKQILISRIADQAALLNMPCYLVGGFVRDLMLNKPINDLDIIVEGDAIKIGQALVLKYGGTLTLHTKFLTANWHLPDNWNLTPNTLDLISARTESYHHSGALPTVKPATIDEDLRRRDFTINAMAIRLDGDLSGNLMDPLGGQKDLEKKLIRILHSSSFLEDPTRIFRALRYEGRYNFVLEPETLHLINSESIGVISKISGERIRHELDLIFEEQNFSQILIRVNNLKVIKQIHFELPAFNLNYSDLLESDTILEIPSSRTNMGYMLWLADLPEEAILSIANRLDFSSDLIHMVWGTAQLKKSLPFLVNSKPSIWVFALENLPLLSIFMVYLISGEKSLLDYLSLWRHIKAHITGDDLKARGIQPGPRYKEILQNLRAAWLDGEVRNFKEEEELLLTLL